LQKKIFDRKPLEPDDPYRRILLQPIDKIASVTIMVTNPLKAGIMGIVEIMEIMEMGES
jgi:hypothetical protein